MTLERTHGPGRILIFDTWEVLYPMGRGGGCPIEGDVFEALLEAGYEIDLIAPAHDAPSDFPSHPAFREHRVTPSPVGIGTLPSRVRASFVHTIRLLLAARRAGAGASPPRVVYGIGAHTIPAAAMYGRLVRRPTIGMLLGTFLYPVLNDKRALVRNFEEVLAFRAPVTRLAILDDGTRGDCVATRLGVRPERVVFRMHGIDRASCRSAADEPLNRSALGLPEHAPLIVSASRLAGWKRVDRALRALPGVLERHPDAVLAIAGDGPAAGDLRRLAEDLGVAKAAFFVGSLDRDTTLRLMASCDVFCSFYDFSNVGLALLEALSCGAAVVVADTGATAEIVEDQVNGLVVSPDDETAAAAAISSLLGDASMRQRLARVARERAEERLMTVEERMRLELELVDELSS